MTDKPFQAPETVIMVRPASFGFNQETAESNSFQQQDPDINPEQIQASALREFDKFAAKLRKAGVDVIVFEDKLEPHTPDAIFPNNWVSFHQDGKVILYPMNAPSRRKERRGEFITALQKEFDFNVDEIIDISYFEKKEQFLEGTGSIVFDYVNKIAYANLSSRTDRTILDYVSTILDYEVFVFEAVDAQGKDIYHTNVV
ncbi:MAG: arginine deiminase-related protein, partial [Cyclobacteriaceae bacterium]